MQREIFIVIAASDCIVRIMFSVLTGLIFH